MNKDKIEKNFLAFSSEEKTSMRRKDLYTDKDGYPNEKAFLQFGMYLDKEDILKMFCLNIELTKANQQEDKGYSYGNYIMRKLIVSIKDLGGFPFRIQGGKFNILAPDDSIEAIRKILDKSNDDYDIYYGFVDEPFEWTKTTELVDKGKKLMYQDRDKKVQNQLSIQRQNPEHIVRLDEPEEIRESKTFKYLETMWYATGMITMKKPTFREAKLYIYATEAAKPLGNFPILVVIDDLGGTPKIYYSTGMSEIGFSGGRISINMRLNGNGTSSLVIQDSTHSKQFEYEFSSKAHAGTCMPPNFGKLIGDNQEIYPIKDNGNGTYSYVKFNRETHEAEWVESGIVTMSDGEYEVHMDTKSINLIKR